MSFIQNLVTALFPKKWADDMRAESERWRIRCLICDYSRTVWEAGGIRWKAASRGKRTMVLCPTCATLRAAAIEYTEKESPSPPSG